MIDYSWYHHRRRCATCLDLKLLCDKGEALKKNFFSKGEILQKNAIKAGRNLVIGFVEI